MPFGDFGKKKKHAQKQPEKKQMVKLINKITELKKEYKYFGTGLSSVGCYATSTMTSGTAGFVYQEVSGITQGTADNQRTGDKLTISSWRVTLGMNQTSGAATAAFNFIKVICFQKVGLSSTSAPVGTEMYNTDQPSGTVSVFSHRNVDYTKLYKVVYEKIFTIVNNNSANPTAQPSNYAKILDFFVPLKHIKKTLSYPSAGNVADEGLYIACVGDKAHNVAGDPVVYWQSRLRFTDS